MSKTYILAKFMHVSAEATDMQRHMSTIQLYSSRCQTAVELGVYDCTSTWALLAGNLKALTSYDVVRRPEVDEVERATSDSDTVFKFVLANSVEVELPEVDLLFIDSYHNYEHLTKELALHASKAKRYIMLHDTTTFAFTDEDYQGKGLWPAITEFLATHPEWTLKERFTHCNGMTILERNRA